MHVKTPPCSFSGRSCKEVLFQPFLLPQLRCLGVRGVPLPCEELFSSPRLFRANPTDRRKPH